MSIDRYLAIAEEEEFGVLPAEPSWIYYDIQSTDLGGPDEQAVTLQTAATRNPRFLAPDIYMIDGSIALPVDDKQFGHIFLGVLGEVATTAVAPQYQHEFTAAAALPTFTVGAGKDFFEHRFSGIVFNELTLEFQDNFLVASISCLGQKDTQLALQTVEEGDLPDFVFTGLCTTTLKGAVDITAKVEDFSMTINNNIEVEQGIPISQRFPARQFAQALEITAEASISFEDETELEEYWGQAGGPAEKNLGEVSLEFQFRPEGPGDMPELTFELPRVVVQSHGADVNERDLIVQELSYEAYEDPVTGHALIVTLLNDVEEY